MNNPHRKGRSNAPKGDRHHNAILKAEDVRSIRRLRCLGIPEIEVARIFGVRATLVKKLDELAKAAKPADSGDAEKI